jgi:transcriptional regulator with XRE-family HTH domain
MGEDIHPVDLLVGRRVRLLRRDRGMSQTALASKLGLTFQQVQKYEKGTNRISASKLYEIADALGVELPSLFQGTEAETTVNAKPTKPAASIDLQISQKLGLLTNDRLKRQLLDLISTLTEDATMSGNVRPRKARRA